MLYWFTSKIKIKLFFYDWYFVLVFKVILLKMDYPRIFRDNSPQSNDVISDVYNYNVKSEPGVTNQVPFFNPRIVLRWKTQDWFFLDCEWNLVDLDSTFCSL